MASDSDSKETDAAVVNNSSLRRRRSSSADDEPRNADPDTNVPALKKPKLETDEEVDTTTESSESNVAETTSAEADQEDEDDEDDGDDDDDDMDLASTQLTTILPTDDDDDEENDDEMDEIVEVPQTPPSVQLTAAAMARHGLANRASPTSAALRIDPSGAPKTTQLTRPHLPSVTETLVFRHKFPVLSDKSRLVSPVQKDATGQSWCIVWFPHGLYLDDKFVSVMVEMVVEDDAASANGVVTPRHVQLELSLVGPHDPMDLKHTIKSHNSILFDVENLENGVREFVERPRLLSPSESLLHSDGEIEVDVRLHLLDGESCTTVADEAVVDLDTLSATDSNDELMDMDGGRTPVLTPTAGSLSVAGTPTGREFMMHYDSKTETGMVGLKNQGATCYMNSLLQTLFHLLAFRHAVYETPTEQEDTIDSVSLALQRVFYRLQTQRKAVSTKELTRSFGWSQMDAFMQHDVQELYRILCDRLEEKMKNTKVDNAIKKLFEGKVRSFVQCVDVDFQSFRDESFYDLQLDVKGCKDIYDSFRKYVEIEMLNGDNQYEAEGHGKQDAKKGVKFVQFPPVLNIQLKRFEYDPMRDGMVKIHDRFEFPKTLVLDEFAPKEDGATQRLVYHLHSVLVHSGDVHGGHYYVFIRPGKDIAHSDDWFKFDDDQISRTDELTAIEGNYGSASSFSSAIGIGGGSSPSTPLYSSIVSPEMTPRGSQGVENGMDFRPLADDADGLSVGDDGGVATAGGSTNTNTTSNNNSLVLPLRRSFASAYMLVYVRDGDNGVDTIQRDAGGEPEPAEECAETKLEPSTTASTSGSKTEATCKATDDDRELATESEEVAVAATEVDATETETATDDIEVPVPRLLLQRFHEEEKATARRKKQQQTEHLFMMFRIASDTSISKLKKITKVVDFSAFSNNVALRIRTKRAATIQQLYNRIHERTGVPVSQQRLWRVITRENRTNRPDSPVTREMLRCRVDSLIDDDATTKAPVRLFLQIVDPPAEEPKRAASIYRHLWSEFTSPKPVQETAETTKGEETAPAAEPAPEEDEDELLGESVAVVGAGSGSDLLVAPAANLGPSEILLFIKFYDVKKDLTKRLEYMGNILFDSRRTGGDLAKHLHAALNIPISTELILFEEIQPASVSEIDMDATLDRAEIQNGDIICYQFAEDEENARMGPIGGDETNPIVEKYSDVPLYFQYLLDRVDVQFCRYGHQDDDPIIVHLLLSNSYDEIIAALAEKLDLPDEKRLYLRLYQHSPLNQQPKKYPLRHSKYSGDNQTTLGDFLTEYSERTTAMHFEILANPITEIESKKQVVVYFSTYDDCFVDASVPVGVPRRSELLVSLSDSLLDLFKQIAQLFKLDASTKLRACEVSHSGSLMASILEADPPLDKYWVSAGYKTANDVALFVETISEEEEQAIAIAIAAATTTAASTATKDETMVNGEEEEEEEENEEEKEENQLLRIGVVHVSFQTPGQHWINPHSVPCVTFYRPHETIRELKERIRRRMAVSEEAFPKWELCVVKDTKATRVNDLFDDMEPDVVDTFPISSLFDLCGSQFELISSLGMEHVDTRPASAPKYTRRQEQGIKIRQS